ncbi:MAG: dihydrofolate reductase [Chloroflexi bacterium]|nr:MAG: dihydrofolate reductase [Chloroflexota bacterium]
MAKVIAGITMSLDGYINDPTGSVGPLYPDFDTMRESESLRETIRDTGAVIMGRHAFAMAEDPDWYAGNYEFQAPIFVLTHTVPEKKPKEEGSLSFTFVTDGIESAIRQAKAAAGERDVMIIGGASTLRQALRSGLVDELDFDVMPVLLCGGLRLFDEMGEGVIQLERIRVMEHPGGRTGMRFRVLGR